MSNFFEPILFEQRAIVLEALDGAGFTWMTDFSSIDLLHREFGLEVTGISEEQTAWRILSIMQRKFRDWPYSRVYYKDTGREIGWMAIRQKHPESNEDWTTA